MARILESTKLETIKDDAPEIVSIEDAVDFINKIKIKDGTNKVNKKSWWIDFKNNNEKKGIDFDDAIIDLVSKEVKNAK